MSKKDCSHGDFSQCMICKHCHDFELPEEILAAAKSGNLVIFAGAGVSTEVPSVMPYTLYADVARELKKDPKKTSESFPELMSIYCKERDGRRKLLNKIMDRFRYVDSFPNLKDSATRFHRELSTIPHIDNIITTNWDSYFEECSGAIPFVSAQDFAFWDAPHRKVFKIHGSVSSYSSIVATTEDYDKCHEQLVKGIIGSNIKMLLATKLVVFIGFSFTDYDFSSVYSLLKEEMKDVLPHSYAVTVSSETAGRFKELGISPIITDGTKFLEVLKARLVADGRMIPDKAFDAVDRRRFQIEDAHLELHNEFSYKENPELIYCAFYQDGLMDAFNRFSVMKKTGECSCPFEMHQRIDTYDRLKKTKKKEKKYDDVAYIEGYSNGLKYVLFDEKSRKKLPVYFLFGYKGEIIKLSEYRRLAKMAREMHRSSYDAAVKITKTTVPGIQIQHTPFLL